MSSLKNAYKIQQVHRERHQKAARAHLGPLEKKKDYKVRAKDQQEKKKTLKKLHKQALMRNPDEYVPAMDNAKLVNGLHFDNVEAKKLTYGDIDQDLNYTNRRVVMEERQIAKLQASLHLLDDSEDAPNSHILFASPEDVDMSVAERLNTLPELVSRRYNRPTVEQLQEMADDLPLKQDIKESSGEKAKAYKELVRRRERLEKLTLVQRKLRNKKLKMQHAEQNKKLIHKLPGPVLEQEGGEGKVAVFRWPKIRKR